MSYYILQNRVYKKVPVMMNAIRQRKQPILNKALQHDVHSYYFLCHIITGYTHPSLYPFRLSCNNAVRRVHRRSSCITLTAVKDPSELSTQYTPLYYIRLSIEVGMGEIPTTWRPYCYIILFFFLPLIYSPC